MNYWSPPGDTPYYYNYYYIITIIITSLLLLFLYQLEEHLTCLVCEVKLKKIKKKL